jgi:hypothetical protein
VSINRSISDDGIRMNATLQEFRSGGFRAHAVYLAGGEDGDIVFHREDFQRPDVIGDCLLFAGESLRRTHLDMVSDKKNVSEALACGFDSSPIDEGFEFLAGISYAIENFKLRRHKFFLEAIPLFRVDFGSTPAAKNVAIDHLVMAEYALQNTFRAHFKRERQTRHLIFPREVPRELHRQRCFPLTRAGGNYHQFARMKPEGLLVE